MKTTSKTTNAVYKIWSRLIYFLSYFNFSKHPLNFLFLRWRIERPHTRYENYSTASFKAGKGDVVFYRTLATVADWTIPGKWTHAGLIIDDQLNMIHSTAPCVQKIHFYDFTRFCDDYIIIRFQLNDEEKNDMVHRAVEQIKTPYDFAFAFTDDRRFSCTELISYSVRPYSEKIGIKLYKRGFWFFKQDTLACDDILKDCKYEKIYSSDGI